METAETMEIKGDTEKLGECRDLESKAGQRTVGDWGR